MSRSTSVDERRHYVVEKLALTLVYGIMNRPTLG